MQNYQEAIEAQRENYVMNRMREFMSQHYNDMKREMGFDENYGEDEDQPHLDAVLSQLKPNMQHSKFIKFMPKQESIHKDVRSKAIQRKVHKQVEDKKFINTDIA